jgi:predicted small lipoprotein YifL
MRKTNKRRFRVFVTFFPLVLLLPMAACGTEGPEETLPDVDAVETHPDDTFEPSEPPPDFQRDETTFEDIEAPFDLAEIETPEITDCLPPPGEPEVFDMGGVERDMAWVSEQYGATYSRCAADAACDHGGVYRLTEFREIEGPSNIDVWVFDEGGSPIASLPVAFYWPDAPETSREDEWYPVKFTGLTNAEGRVGFAMGSGSYHGPGEGGPHGIWVSDEAFPSDLADRLGMLGGTNHRHLNVTFVLIRVH